MEICSKLELKLSKGYPNPLFRLYRDFEDDSIVPIQVREIVSKHVSKITVWHAQALVKLRDYPEKQLELAELIVTKSLTGPQAVTWAKRWLGLYAVPEVEFPPDLARNFQEEGNHKGDS